MQGSNVKWLITQENQVMIRDVMEAAEIHFCWIQILLLICWMRMWICHAITATSEKNIE